MKLISHRGNLSGPNPKDENSPAYIEAALNKGFDVEIDVWIVNGRLLLGHDIPQYPTTYEFLSNKKLWCHAKNCDALFALRSRPPIHCFWHQQDDYTITSKGIVWVYPGKRLLPQSVAVKPEQIYLEDELEICSGICSDYILQFKSKSKASKAK
jgi:hypothetical protein